MKKNRKVLLLQPRSAWGNHVYLVNGLLATAARLRISGFDVEIRDLNIDEGISQTSIESADLIGISVLGSPYIPQAFKLAKELRELGYNGRIFFGGPILENITPEDWQKLFHANGLENVVAVREEIDLQLELGIIKSIPSIYNLSMGEQIEALPEYMQRAYFEKEFCIFTSDGCKFNCSFCGAHKDREESFRDPIAFRKEMATLGKMVAKYAGSNPNYEIYLSTLDGLQNWVDMEKTLEIIHDEFSKAGVFVPLRFLATSKYVSLALQADPDILKRWKELGVMCIGIGVDGDDEKTWQLLRKSHNRRNEIQNAIIGIQDAGMIAEAFMIFGGPEESTEATLKAVAACKRLTEQGVKVRPYFMKMKSPKLNTKHTKENEKFEIEPYLGNINLFYHIDYGMLGSKLTNPNAIQREFANRQFLDVIDWLNRHNPYGCPTQPLLPTEDGSEIDKEYAHKWNRNMPMDR